MTENKEMLMRKDKFSLRKTYFSCAAIFVSSSNARNINSPEKRNSNDVFRRETLLYNFP